jgi:hypothetical protein
MLTRRSTIRLAIVLAPVALLARAAPASAHDLTGDYDGPWGATTLTQEGYHVSGTYARHHGQITGVIDGDTMRFAWIQDDGSGRGVLHVGEDGALSGTWGVGYDDHHGGDWQLTRADAATGVVVAAPHAGSWTLGFRYPWDVESVPNGVLLGLGGAGLDLGFRLFDRLYIGGTGESEAIMRVSGPPGAKANYDRLRAGGEARLYFHDDDVSMSRAFLGARYGIETFDEGATVGRFADGTLGFELQLGEVSVGLSITAGISREPLTTFEAGPTQPVKTLGDTSSGTSVTGPVATPTHDNPYVAFGMSLLF